MFYISLNTDIISMHKPDSMLIINIFCLTIDVLYGGGYTTDLFKILLGLKICRGLRPPKHAGCYSAILVCGM